MITLPQAFIGRMSRIVGNGLQDFLHSYSLPAARAIRVNTLKTSVNSFKDISPFELQPVPWEESGFYVNDEKPGKTILHAAGVYYVQEPSAMCAAPLLNVQPGELVLDLCSAPGGKGTQLAQKMQGKGMIVLNEINFSRAKILSSNVERLGITNAVVTCAPPHVLAARLGGVFNKVLVDAPCSGEGMFKKEPNAIAEWSEQNVLMCADRQAQILQSAADLLAAGGSMVYSTCTFSREEDEEQISNFLSGHKNFTLVSEHKLYPHQVRGEGHYAALLRKDEGQTVRPPVLRAHADRRLADVFSAFAKSCLNISFGNIHAVGNRLYSLPNDCINCGVQTLRAGVELGEVIKDRFVPAHALAMCMPQGGAQFLPLDGDTALAYLSGATFNCATAVSGWAVATYLGFPLGWCKVTQGVAKNHLPKALRINN